MVSLANICGRDKLSYWDLSKTSFYLVLYQHFQIPFSVHEMLALLLTLTLGQYLCGLGELITSSTHTVQSHLRSD